ncbi:hypothetical protein [Luteimonas notoginsengisoli]|uniref:Uncharacterized protein n=1 Tax=Luteimonas notoginsengisoli TaxID=1578200 RepID=A0ABV7UPZ6_9GAMM
MATLLYWISREAPRPETPTSAQCSGGDAACIGQRLQAGIQAGCTAKIAALLAFEPQWTEGMFDARFSNPAWYVPGDSIVFTGNDLVASNAMGAQKRVQYFCVVDAETGQIINAGAPELR